MSRQKLNYNIGSRTLFARTRAGRRERTRALGGFDYNRKRYRTKRLRRSKTNGGGGGVVVECVGQKRANWALSLARPSWADHRTRHIFYRAIGRTAGYRYRPAAILKADRAHVAYGHSRTLWETGTGKGEKSSNAAAIGGSPMPGFSQTYRGDRTEFRPNVSAIPGATAIDAYTDLSQKPVRNRPHRTLV